MKFSLKEYWPVLVPLAVVVSGMALVHYDYSIHALMDKKISDATVGEGLGICLFVVVFSRLFK